MKKHSDEVKKIMSKIKQEIVLEKKSRKASVKREFIEIYVKVELSKTIHDPVFFSKAENIVAEEAKKASQMKNKKKGKKVAVGTTIQGIIKGGIKKSNCLIICIRNFNLNYL